MKIRPSISVLSPDRIEHEIDLHISAELSQECPEFLSLEDAYAYIPLINSHDHLIGNWVPRAGDNRPYPNSHIWVEDMKHSFAFRERDLFWVNDGSFILTDPDASVLATLGTYKNLFSGCGIVQDHAPLQANSYYQQFPIRVVNAFHQCHSITLGNWWGGGTPEQELALSEGKVPFIIHLGEGTDEITKVEFKELKKRHLLKRNTLMIHGIAFSHKEIEEIASVNASVCWCPGSNMYLIGKTFDVSHALSCGANVCIGTDSTMSGGINLIDEFLTARKVYPDIKATTLYKMATVNAVHALMLPEKYAYLDPNQTSNLLLIDKIDGDPYENLLDIEAENIRLLMVDDIPRYGDADWLDFFEVNSEVYTIFRTGKREKFVLGDPMELNDMIDAKLGYHKDFPYLPF